MLERGADGPPARERESLVVAAIALERVPRPVGLVPVGLEHQALGAPDKIGTDRRLPVVEDDELVHLGHRKARRSAQLVETLLELAPRQRAADAMLVENGPDERGPSPVGVALELILDSAQVEQLERLRLVERSLDAAAGKHVGDVELRPSHGRAGDAVDARRVGWGEGGRTVDVDPYMPAARAARDRHLDVLPARVEDAVQLGR